MRKIGKINAFFVKFVYRCETKPLFFIKLTTFVQKKREFMDIR